MRHKAHQSMVVGRGPKHPHSLARKSLRTPPQQRGTMRRSTLKWCVVASLVLLLLVAILQGKPTLWGAHMAQSWTTWTAHQGFVLQNVAVTGRKNLSATDMWQTLNIKQGEPLFAISPQKIHDALVTQQWVKQAWVSRQWPNTLRIVLQERVPVAQWQVNGQKLLVDADSVVLAKTIAPQFQKLPVVVGNHAPQQVQTLLQLLQGEPNIAKQMLAATWVGNRRWDLHFKNNLVVKLPEAEPQLAFSQLAQLDAEQQLLARDIVSIDLRLANKMVLQPTPRANLLIQRPNFDPDAKVNQPVQGKQI